MKNESKKIKIKGIPFGVLLAGKVADGTKTVTRRVVAINGNPVLEPIEIEEADSGFVYNRALGNFPVTGALPCPYTVGQLLYVREPWQAAAKYDKPSGSSHIPDDGEIAYLSDNGGTRHEFGGRRRIARFMPARFARTFLKVTGVRCERLVDISGADAIAEGITTHRKDCTCHLGVMEDWCRHDARARFSTLWDFINHKKPAPKFADNPWVWVISFVKVEMPNPWNSNQSKK